MSEPNDVLSHGDRTAGICLVVAAAIAIFTMAHHPTSHDGGSLGAIVHGTMIAVLAMMLYGFVRFALSRGFDRPLVLMGLIAYGIGTAGNLSAATINGFIAPALAAGESGTINHDILRLCWEANQAFARLGVFATGVAFTAWSVDYLLRNGWANRAIGALGLLGGVAPAVILLGGRALDVPTALAIYASHAVWTILVGIQLILRRIR